MIPRAFIIAVQQNYSFKQINDIINKESHSRMPVYRKDQMIFLHGSYKRYYKIFWSTKFKF